MYNVSGIFKQRHSEILKEPPLLLPIPIKYYSDLLDNEKSSPQIMVVDAVAQPREAAAYSEAMLK